MERLDIAWEGPVGWGIDRTGLVQSLDIVIQAGIGVVVIKA